MLDNFAVGLINLIILICDFCLVIEIYYSKLSIYSKPIFNIIAKTKIVILVFQAMIGSY